MPFTGGKSYQPGQMPGADGQAPEPQEAVRILNLRLPKTAGPSPIPRSLLSAQGGGGADLTALLRTLMQAFAGGTATGNKEIVGSGGPGIDTGQIGARPMMPTPRIRPGGEGGERLPDTGPPAPLFDEPTPERFGFQPSLGRPFRGSGPLF